MSYSCIRDLVDWQCNYVRRVSHVSSRVVPLVLAHWAQYSPKHTQDEYFPAGKPAQSKKKTCTHRIKPNEPTIKFQRRSFRRLARFISLCKHRQQLVCVCMCPHTCGAQLVTMLGAQVQRSEPGFIMACPLSASTHAISPSLSAALRSSLVVFLSCPPCPPVSRLLLIVPFPAYLNPTLLPVQCQSSVTPHLCLWLLPHGLLTWCIHLFPHVEKRDNNRTIRRGGVAHSDAVVIFNGSEITVWLKQHTLFYSEHHGCVQSKNPPRQQGGQRDASCSGLFCFLL